MRHVIYILLLVAGMVLAILYLQHITRMPEDAGTTVSDSLKTSPRIGGTIRQKVGRDLRTHEGRLNETLRETEQ